MTTGKINCSTKCPLGGTGRATLRGFLEDCKLVSRVEAGLNISTSSLRVVGGDKKGSFECGKVKYDREPTELRSENECGGKDQQQL
jgi:hypothetical protein